MQRRDSEIRLRWQRKGRSKVSASKKPDELSQSDSNRQHTERIAQVLTTLAEAAAPAEIIAAINDCKDTLGDEFEIYQTLLETMTHRAYEVRELRRAARCDMLTGIANRRAFEETLDREVALHRRTGEALSVLFLDMDGFKNINDTLGHKVGDEALIAVARVCQRTLRQSDLVARFGGDEMAILLPQTPETGAKDVAKRLRHAVENTQIHGRRLRISIGVATREGLEVATDALLQEADDALYIDKRSRKEKRRSAAA